MRITVLTKHLWQYPSVMALVLGGIVLNAASTVHGQAYFGYPGYQVASPAYTPQVLPTAPAPPVMATPQVVAAMTTAQLDQLLAPIALDPDPLLAEILPASTYSQEIQQAAGWLAQNPTSSQVLIDMQPWDASVKALLHYPTVLANMNANPLWTQALGTAFLNQQADVMAAIQRLRTKALAIGVLRSTPQQQVIAQNGVIWIEPANPQVLYVPQYDPALAYLQWPGYAPGVLVTFGVGYGIGNWLDNSCDWSRRWVDTGGGWQRDWRRDDHGRWLRRPLANGPGRGRGPRGPVPRRWSHDPRRPLPALPPNMIAPGALRPYRGWQVQPVRPSSHGRQPQYTPRPQPSVFGGTYRSENNVRRQANRGLQSWRESQSHFNRARPTQYRAPRVVGRNLPRAFQGVNAAAQTRQDSQRGRASMAPRR